MELHAIDARRSPYGGHFGNGYSDLAALADGRFGVMDVACPWCGPHRKSPANRRRQVLRLWRPDESAISYCCARCGICGLAKASRREFIPKDKPRRVLNSRAALPENRIHVALRLWREASEPGQSPVTAYLDRRGVRLPPGASGATIRWHPNCPFGAGARTGAMIALVRHVITDEPLGIHRTALDGNGRKIEIGGVSRMTLGSTGRGAVKLTSDSDIETCLGLGEGIETALSLRGLDGLAHMPVWSVLAANRLAAFPVLDGIQGLWLAVDHDKAGIAAAAAARIRWQDAGVDVVTVTPRAPGADLNDLMTGGYNAA